MRCSTILWTDLVRWTCVVQLLALWHALEDRSMPFQHDVTLSRDVMLSKHLTHSGGVRRRVVAGKQFITWLSGAVGCFTPSSSNPVISKVFYQPWLRWATPARHPCQPRATSILACLLKRLKPPHFMQCRGFINDPRVLGTQPDSLTNWMIS